MDKEVIVRRAMHCLIALAPLYFLLPVDLPVIGVRRWVLLIALFVGVGGFDAWRRWKGITFFGLRQHERKSVASFAWAAAGITFVLWLIPHDVATAALISMAFVDPLAGEMRTRYGGTPPVVSISIFVYFWLAFSTIALWSNHDLAGSAILALIGAGVAIPSEAIKTKLIDDDFTMLTFPAVIMSWVAEAL